MVNRNTISIVNVSFYIDVREGRKTRETDRDRHRDRQRQTERQIQRQRERQTRETDRETDIDIDIDRDRDQVFGFSKANGMFFKLGGASLEIDAVVNRVTTSLNNMFAY